MTPTAIRRKEEDSKQPTTGLEAIIRHDGDEKYIVVHTAASGQSTYTLVSLPLEYHSDILRAFQREAKTPMQVLGGGILTMDPEAKTIRTYGKSGSFGKPDPKLVSAILESAYPGYTLDVKVTDFVRG